MSFDRVQAEEGDGRGPPHRLDRVVDSDQQGLDRRRILELAEGLGRPLPPPGIRILEDREQEGYGRRPEPNKGRDRASANKTVGIGQQIEQHRSRAEFSDLAEGHADLPAEVGIRMPGKVREPLERGRPDRDQGLGSPPAESLLVRPLQCGKERRDPGRLPERTEGGGCEMADLRRTPGKEPGKPAHIAACPKTRHPTFGVETPEEAIGPAHGGRDGCRRRKDQLVAAATQSSRGASRASAPHMLGRYAKPFPLFVRIAP